VRTKSIRYRFCFHKLDAAHSIAAVGELAVVAVTKDPATGKMKSAPIPDAFRNCIEAAPGPPPH
jgi:hypothetical protein